MNSFKSKLNTQQIFYTSEEADLKFTQKDHKFKRSEKDQSLVYNLSLGLTIKL